MPQLSSDTDHEGRNISERDLAREERRGRSPADCSAEEAAAHHTRAKPILDAAKKLTALAPKVTSQCRVDSAAHYFDAVDFSAADPHKLAAELSKCLGKEYFVQVEEVLSDGEQKNTTYVKGAAQPAKTIKVRQGVTGTHVHVQTPQERRPRDREPR